MSFQPEITINEDGNGIEIQWSQVHDESINSGGLSPQDPDPNQDPTIEHVGEGSSHLASPESLWQYPQRSLEEQAAVANKYGRKPSNAPETGLPVPLLPIDSQYNTEHYTKFDRNAPYDVERAKGFKPFSIYDPYHLCMDLSIERAEDIPQLPVRLDDRLCALVYENFHKFQLNYLWPSEFDSEGMVRAKRVPLGNAAKHYYKAGDIDYDGNILQPGEEDWYYLWLGGVQCLMGKEGWDAGRYLKRPRGEKRIKGFAFKKLCKAEIQAPPGSDVESSSVT